MNKLFYFFFSNSGKLNEVTIPYVKVLEEALEEIGFKVIYTFNLEEIPIGSNILSITDMCNFRALIKRKPRFSVNWYQGIIPEEAALTFAGKLSKYPRIALHNFLESYTLKRNNLNIFVSQRMREHYELKYGIDLENSFIMPCFNCTLDEGSFVSDRYLKPRFVYAGSLAKWQCVEPMLMAFKKLQSHLPNAQLTIFTKDVSQAQKLADETGLEIEIQTLPPEVLNQRLKEFKYGLLFRDNIKVNNVATPTKINNYMGCGLIPVFSDVINAYSDLKNSNKYVITFEDTNDFIKKIMKMEEQKIDKESLLNSHKETFNNYWNLLNYKNLFQDKIGQILRDENSK